MDKYINEFDKVYRKDNLHNEKFIHTREGMVQIPYEEYLEMLKKHEARLEYDLMNVSSQHIETLQENVYRVYTKLNQQMMFRDLVWLFLFYFNLFRFTKTFVSNQIFLTVRLEKFERQLAACENVLERRYHE